MKKKWIMMWEEEPIATFSSQADCEEFFMDKYFDNLYDSFCFCDYDIKKFLKNYSSHCARAKYGYWWKEIICFD